MLKVGAFKTKYRINSDSDIRISDFLDSETHNLVPVRKIEYIFRNIDTRFNRIV